MVFFYGNSMTNLIEQQKLNKRAFNINNESDVDEFKFFLINKRWKNVCPFHVKWPYINVVDMIKDEIVTNFVTEKVDTTKRYDFSELQKAMR